MRAREVQMLLSFRVTCVYFIGNKMDHRQETRRVVYTDDVEKSYDRDTPRVSSESDVGDLELSRQSVLRNALTKL